MWRRGGIVWRRGGIVWRRRDSVGGMWRRDSVEEEG